LTCYRDGGGGGGGGGAGAYGEKRCYLYVYGVRQTVYLMFNDNTSKPVDWMYRETRRAAVTRLQELGAPFVRDAKLVFKRPYSGACMGPRLFLKLYIGGETNFSPHKLRDALQTLSSGSDNKQFSCIDKYVLHGQALSPETRWFNAKRARCVGRIRTTKPVAVVDRRLFFEAQVHHDFVQFDTGEELAQLTADYDDSDVFALIIRDVIEPVLASCNVSVATKNVILHDVNDARDKFVRSPDPWTWPRLKRVVLDTVFRWMRKGTGQNTSIDSHVKRYAGYLADEATKIGGLSLTAAIPLVYFETLHVQYEVRAKLKRFWLQKLEARPGGSSSVLDELTTKISEAKRWLVFDIETDHRPHEDKEETIIAISTALFTHATGDVAEYRLFLRLSPTEDYETRRDGVSSERIAALVRTQLGEKYSKDFVAGKTFEIVFSRTELDLLTQFQSYAARTQCSFVAYFNGHKFDLPFLANRHAINAAYTTPAQRRALRRISPNTRPRVVNYSFTHKSDEGYYRYDPPSKKQQHTSYGRRMWAEDMRKRHRRPAAESSDGEDDQDDDDEEEEEEEQEAERTRSSMSTGQYQGFLAAARKVKSVLMNHVALVDVMLHVGDRNRGCKLDTAAEKFLDVRKYADEAVGYDKLCDTWQRGDLNKLAGYAMIDTIITMQLIVARRLNSFYRNLCNIIGLSERVIVLEESLRRLISIGDRIGYGENLLTPDTSLVRSDEYLWKPNHTWNSQRDYENLRSPGGTTVPGVAGVYFVPCVTYDFKSQYPAIMSGYNYCASTLIGEKDVERFNLRPNTDYRKLELNNVRPVFRHVCDETRCAAKTEPMKCKFRTEYARVTYTAYFVTDTYYPSVMRRSTQGMSRLRVGYQQQRDDAYARGDFRAGQAFDTAQLAVKIVDNSTYGGTVRISRIVGDAITKQAREQTHKIAELAYERRMAVVNGDTDSVFLQLFPDPRSCDTFVSMARSLGLDPKSVTVTEIFEKCFEVAEKFTKFINVELKPFPEPCFLELEKIFVCLCNLAKKNYAGEKLLPGSPLAIAVHRTGMSGKKADTTKVKWTAQFAAVRLLVRRDIPGLLLYMRHLYDLASWEIRHQERKEERIKTLCESIQSGGSGSGGDDERRAISEILTAEETRQSAGESLLPLGWICSKERVRNVDTPKTVAEKLAVQRCLYRGESILHAPMFVEICRSSSVQVASGFLKILDTLLRAPTTPVFAENHRKRFNAANRDSAARAAKKRLDAARSKKEAAEEDCRRTVTKLAITAMPEKFRAAPSQRFFLTTSEREKAEVLRYYISDREKCFKAEKNQSAVVVVSPPTVVNDAHARERLRTFIEEFQSRDCDPFPPLSMFVPPIATSRVAELTRTNCLARRGAACDLWTLYVNDLASKGLHYIRVSWSVEEANARLEFFPASPPPPPPPPPVQSGGSRFEPEDWSWITRNVHRLTNAPDSFLLDMSRYGDQTSSTPYLVPSYGADVLFLVNRDSFRPVRRNTFGFRIRSHWLLEALHPCGDGPVRVGNVPSTRYIRLVAENRRSLLEIDEILRDDGRTVEKWYRREEPFTVKADAFTTALEKVCERSLAEVRHVSVILNRDENRLIVADEDEFAVVHVSLSKSGATTVNVSPETESAYATHYQSSRKRKLADAPDIRKYFVPTL
jgi:DNA polymerase elongation subunit (family B)